MSIRAKGDRMHRTRMAQRLQSSATQRVEDANRRVCPPTSEQAAIRSKGQTVGVLLPACPEQSATLHVPEFDGVIPTPAGQKPSIRAEGKGVYDRAMGLPDSVERL